MVVPWWVLAIMSIVGYVPIFWIIETDGFQGNAVQEESDDEEEEDEQEVDGNGNAHKYGSTTQENDSLPISKTAAEEEDSTAPPSPSGSTLLK